MPRYFLRFCDNSLVSNRGMLSEGFFHKLYGETALIVTNFCFVGNYLYFVFDLKKERKKEHLPREQNGELNETDEQTNQSKLS